MSDISKSAIGEKFEPAFEAKLAECKTPEEIKSLMHDRELADGKTILDWDPAYRIPVADAAPQSATFKKSFTINGQVKVIEGSTELELAQAETALFKSLVNAPAASAAPAAAPAAAAEPARGTDGRFIAENAVDVEELRMQMIQGTITPEEFVARSGIIERVIDQRAERATVAGWEAATQEFLNSPEGSNWPGSSQMGRMQQILIENHLENAEDKLEALKSAWLFMQEQDYETQIHETLKDATPSQLRDAIGYGRNSSMFSGR